MSTAQHIWSFRAARPSAVRISIFSLSVALVIAFGVIVAGRLTTPTLEPLGRSAPSLQLAQETITLTGAIDLTFKDRADGAVLVYDANRDILIDELAPGSNGFVRGVLRALTRDRAVRAIGAAPPFRLSRGHDGRLILLDTSTGQLIALDAFGHTNSESFGRLLAAAHRIGRDPNVKEDVR